MIKMLINKCIILAAGLSTRLYPATKVIPKPMFPIYDTPIIQILVEQVKAAGITDIAIVTHSITDLIEEHFLPNVELERELKAKGKDDLAKQVNDMVPGVNITFFKQVIPGAAGALITTKEWLNEEPFLLLYCDEVIFEEHLPKFLNSYNGNHLIFSTKRPASEAPNYGTIIADENSRAIKIQEKVPVTDRDTVDIVLGKSILNYNIFEAIDKLEKDHVGELVLTNAIGLDLENIPVYIHKTNYEVFDTGNADGYLDACIAYKNISK